MSQASGTIHAPSNIEEEQSLEDDADEIEDVLHVEALMGWDGDRCECPVCDCLRFIDEANQAWCLDCREGRHWPPGDG